MRNTICVSNLNPDLHDWLKEQADQRTKKGQRVTMSELFNEAVTLLKQKYDDEAGVTNAN